MKLFVYIVFSGVHASGKTTIAKKICAKNGFIFFPETNDVSVTNPLSLSPYERELWFMDNLERRERKLINTQGICICDRWVGDVLRYTQAFYKLNLITDFQKENIFRRYYSIDWLIPDLEIIFTADDFSLEKRILNRGRVEEQKREELKLAKIVREEFLEYANGHRFNREIEIIDTSEKSIEETCREIEFKIENFLRKFSIL